MKDQILYQERYGPVNYPQQFAQLLEGRSLEEQTAFFRIGCGTYRHYPLQERKKSPFDYSCRLEEEEEVQALIVKDGKIAGVLVTDVYGKTVPCLVEQGYCIRADEELDGSGYKTHTLYQYLICVPETFDGP